MRVKTTLLSACVALSVPLSAAAKPPVTGGCQLFFDDPVSYGVPFRVTVAKDPSYPGQWFAPEVSVTVTVPVDPGVLGPNSYSQTVTQAVDGLGGANQATAHFVIPAVPNLIPGGEVKAVATVSEPLNKNKLTETESCEGFTVLGF